MIGVTLRCTWITSAMCMVPGLRARLPIRGGYHKKVNISPGSGSLAGDKNTESLCIKKNLPITKTPDLETPGGRLQHMNIQVWEVSDIKIDLKYFYPGGGAGFTLEDLGDLHNDK